LGIVNLDMVFRIAGIAILVAVIHSVLKQAGKEEYAWMLTVTGIVIVLIWVVQLVGDLFEKVRTIFRLY
jgi:stage III sporulation protein AC